MEQETDLAENKDSIKLVEQLEAEVKQARKRGNIKALISIANDALRQIDDLLTTDPYLYLSDEEKRSILQATKRIGYNAAADIYPGWEVGTPPRSEAELSAAVELAQKSSAAVDKLALGAIPQGNAIWLLGALDLARGQLVHARSAFQKAADLFEQGGAPESKLLAVGYAAISSRSKIDFDAAIADLEKLNSEDAVALRDQLIVALQVFPI
jgi:hypothetical protein